MKKNKINFYNQLKMNANKSQAMERIAKINPAMKSKLIAKLTEEIYDNLRLWSEVSIALDKPEYEKLLDEYCPYDNRDKITRYSWLLGQIRGAYPNLNLTISIDGQDAHGPHIVWLNGKKF